MPVAPLEPTDAFVQGLAQLDLSLEADELEQLGRYLAFLLETNRQFNLTAVREPDAAWLRHVLDSLSLLPFIDDAARVVDIGSGGGMPGLILAIAMPQVHWTLVESTGKKARFLTQAVEMLGLENVQVINDRSETIGRMKRYRETFDLAVARAVGRLAVLLELTVPLVRVGGRVLAMKGRSAESELQEAGDALMLLGCGEVAVYETMPGLEDEAVVVCVEKLNRTPGEYPRLPGTPAKEPLGT